MSVSVALRARAGWPTRSKTVGLVHWLGATEVRRGLPRLLAKSSLRHGRPESGSRVIGRAAAAGAEA